MDRLQRLQDRALWLPLAGLALLSPPLLAIFGGPATVLGVPVLYVYVFVVWIALIGLGRACSRALQASTKQPAADGGDGTE